MNIQTLFYNFIYICYKESNPYEKSIPEFDQFKSQKQITKHAKKYIKTVLQYFKPKESAGDGGGVKTSSYIILFR